MLMGLFTEDGKKPSEDDECKLDNGNGGGDEGDDSKQFKKSKPME